MKDYGIRPGLHQDYQDMMKTLSKKAAFDRRPERDSEFEKPYLTDDYAEQQQLHDSNFHPYLPPMGDALEVPEITAGARTSGCNGSVLRATTADGTDECPTNGSVLLFMAGHDGNGNPWDQSQIMWKLVEPAKGQLVSTGLGTIYYAPGYTGECQGWNSRAAEDSVGLYDNIIGIHPECGYSNVVVEIGCGETPITAVLTAASGASIEWWEGFSPFTVEISSQTAQVIIDPLDTNCPVGHADKECSWSGINHYGTSMCFFCDNPPYGATNVKYTVVDKCGNRSNTIEVATFTAAGC